MARGRKNGKAKAKVARISVTVDGSRVQHLAREIETAKAETAATREWLNEALDAGEEAGIHKAALKLAVKVKAMEPLKAQAFTRAFAAYCDVLGVDDQLDMLAQQQQRERDDAATAAASAPAETLAAD